MAIQLDSVNEQSSEQVESSLSDVRRLVELAEVVQSRVKDGMKKARKLKAGMFAALCITSLGIVIGVLGIVALTTRLFVFSYDFLMTTVLIGLAVAIASATVAFYLRLTIAETHENIETEERARAELVRVLWETKEFIATTEKWNEFAKAEVNARLSRLDL